jgi:hypothetical protein
MAVTAAQVAGWGKFPVPTGDDLEHLELVIAAVTAHVIKYYETPEDEEEEWPATTTLAVVLQVSRLWKRRGTPEGFIAFEELGAVRITKLDNDVETLLTPVWGFA